MNFLIIDYGIVLIFSVFNGCSVINRKKVLPQVQPKWMNIAEKRALPAGLKRQPRTISILMMRRNSSSERYGMTESFFLFKEIPYFDLLLRD
jgi:hypothetical protein